MNRSTGDGLNQADPVMQPYLDPAVAPFEHDRARRLVVELAGRQIVFGRPAMDADFQALAAAMRRKRPVLVDADEGDRFAVRGRRVKRDVLRLECRARSGAEDFRDRDEPDDAFRRRSR
jgi:hypothetical protein